MATVTSNGADITAVVTATADPNHATPDAEITQLMTDCFGADATFSVSYNTVSRVYSWTGANSKSGSATYPTALFPASVGVLRRMLREARFAIVGSWLVTGTATQSGT